MGIESQATDLRSGEPSPARLEGEPRLRTLLILGQGGMGRVELAEEESATPCIVAVKRLLPELVTSREKRELFAREAAIACRLEHPNLVRTRRYGEVGGEPFLVMDYVDGVTLDRLLELAKENGLRLPRELSAFVLAEVAQGLHVAHEMRDENGEPLRLVHRDISPHNVMVGRSGNVLLLDFGVAKIEAERGLTRTGEVRGKTAYMSPEQGLGDPLDRRSDLFALGAVLHECVQGARMWGDGTDLDVLRKLALERPPELPGQDRLSRLCGRLVEKDRELRPATAREVADEALSLALESSGKSVNELRDALSTFVLELALDELEVRRREIASARKAASASSSRAMSVPAVLSDEREESSLATSSRSVAAADMPPMQRSRSRGWLGGLLALGVVGTLAFAAARRADPPGKAPESATTGTTSLVSSAPSGVVTSASAMTSAKAAQSASTPDPSASTSPPLGKATAAHASTGGASAGPRVPPSASAPHVSPSTQPSHGPLNVDPTPF